MKHALLAIEPSGYQNHALHRGERAWLETNCYVDLSIEVLHAHGLDPHAGLGFTLAVDFEGDQWLFFKQPAHELALLYGFNVQELNIWRSLREHVAMQLARGRLVLLEVDAFYLPDTAGVSYRSQHTKTTIGIEMLDAEQRRLGYFHNAGYHLLAGEDFEALLGAAREAREPLVPYTEFASFAREQALAGEALVEAARALLQKHVARMPRENPIRRFRDRFQADLGWLAAEPQATFHAYAFANLRQLGAAYELAASHLRWLAQHDTPGLSDAVSAFDTIASEAKLLQFKSARAVVLKKPATLAPILDTMQVAYDVGKQALSGWAAG